MVRRLLCALGALLLLAPAASAGTPAEGFGDTAAATGLTAPTAVAFLPNGDMLVTEKTGALKLVQGGTATTLVILPVCTASEMGLLGVAVDPGFTTNGFIYLYRTKPAPSGCGSPTGRFNQVVRVQMSGGSVSIGSLTELLTGIRTDNGNHNGGGMRIGPDGKLWVAVGETGLGDTGTVPPGASTNPYAQDLSALEGKLLRLELSGAPASGNPTFADPDARPEIYAYGFRNPWRFGFDPVTGKAWIGDVGQQTLEELDIVQPGGNYAWPHCEGTLPTGCQQPGDIDPIFTYPRSGTTSLGRTIVGGAFAPESFGRYGGEYFFADYIAGNVYRVSANTARDGLAGTPTTFVSNGAGPVDVVFGPDEALYYASINAGQIRRVAPAYARPQGAAQLRVPLSVAYRECLQGSTNRSHSGGLAHPSCNPAVQASSWLTVGTLDSNGWASQSVGSVEVTVCPSGTTASGACSTPADMSAPDVRIAASVTDVRCKVGPAGGQAACEGGVLSDYTGGLRGLLPLRVTDRSNGGASFTQPGTGDTTFPFEVPCTANQAGSSITSVGGTCSVVTRANAVVPGAVQPTKRGNWELGQIELTDGGADGSTASAVNTVFARQGVFVP
jgi:glucose/arabinose dehydrogenase